MTVDLRLLKEEKLRRLYRRDPVLYAEQVLGVQLWEKQKEIAQALVTYKRVLVKASHSIGKTMLGGVLVNWFFDCYCPGITLTTAPTAAQVDDLLWKEVRVRRKGRPGLMPKASRMETAPDHFAVGYTANEADAFQGRHEEYLFTIFDEATGVDSDFWDATEGMMTGDGCYWLAILNPTDTSCRAYQEEQEGGWHVISVSAMEHPNIVAECAGLAAPFPAAVRLGWLQERIRRWCEPVPAGDRDATDFEFPPDSGEWHRPGPLFEGRVLGRWPKQGATSVWSEAMWEACQVFQEPGKDDEVEIGCDVARFGDDFTSIVVRQGPCVLHHETHNGWSTKTTAERLRALADIYAPLKAKSVKIKIDDDGVGGGVVDLAEGYNFCPVSAASRAYDEEDYPNRRSELWFSTAGRAKIGRIDVTRLGKDSKRLLQRQFMAPTWKVDGNGCRVVEPKEQTKKRLKRSPDDADSFNLAFAPAATIQAPITSKPKDSAPYEYQPEGDFKVSEYTPLI